MSRLLLLQLLAVLSALTSISIADADTITLRGTTIAVPVQIERIATGRVFYVDHAGRSMYRSLDDVEHITFSNLPQLGEAAKAIDDDRHRDALPHLMRALLVAEKDVQRIWIHSLLVRGHDVLGEYVQACGHFAALVTLDEHGYWRGIAPMSELNEPTFAAAEEAMVHLRQAQQRVTHAQLGPILAQMIQRVQPIHRRLAEAYDGPPIERGSTVSGIAIDVIQRTTAHADEESQAELPEAPTAAEVREEEPTPPAATVNGQSIARLLAAEHWEEALAACERAARQPGRHDAAELLYQHGRALVGVGRPRDAAIQYTRCAILHRGSPHASLSLIETAIIYRDTFNRHDAALRLLDRAIEEEKTHKREDVVRRIAQVRQTLQQH